MTDLDLWKAIHKAVANISMADVSQAVAEVRSILAEADKAAEPPSRTERGGRDRMQRGGPDRSSE